MHYTTALSVQVYFLNTLERRDIAQPRNVWKVRVFSERVMELIFMKEEED
jgi:hypothetical protein